MNHNKNKKNANIKRIDEKRTNSPSPPKLAEKLLDIFSREGNRPYLLGDLEEDFGRISRESGVFYAVLWYWYQTLIPVPTFIKNRMLWSFAMLNNYLKIAFRNIKRHKVYSFINIFGLAAGLTCFLLTFLWVQDEFRYDMFHENVDSLYRINSTNVLQTQTLYSPETPFPLADALKSQYPEIINSVNFTGDFTGRQLNYEDKYFTNDRLICVAPSFFDVFTFPFVIGDPKTALSSTFSIVISEKMAKKYFGDADPLGKIISIDDHGFEVKGIIKNIPEHSHLQFDAAFPINYWGDARGMDMNGWTQNFPKTFIQIRENTNIASLEQKIAGTISQINPDLNVTLEMQSLKDIRLYTDFSHEFWGKGKKIDNVYLFGIIGICVLFIACINFMNLSTALSGKRAKEIGVRKVTGAKRKDLITQFFIESVFLSNFAMVIALMLCSLLLPSFNDLTGKNLSIESIMSFNFVLGLILLSIFTGIISGSYPAFFLSRLKPALIIKGVNRSGDKVSGNLRKVLVITQFAMTVVLMIQSMTLYEQLDFINNQDQGYDAKNIITMDRKGAFTDNYEMAKSELLRSPNVVSVTRSRQPLMAIGMTNEISWEGKAPESEERMFRVTIDHDYLNMYKIKLADGRFYSKDIPSDTLNYLINETAVKSMGFENPIGKRFSYQGREGTIIGVVKDFIHQSMRHNIEPQFFYYNTGSRFFAVKLGSDNFSASLEFMKEKWSALAPGTAFKYSILEEKIDNFYSDEGRNIKLVTFFTLLAIIISCMGLFGLATFIAELRTKEIGIRKVLGSSITEVVLLLVSKFVLWIVAANIIAYPIAYYIGNNLLQSYVFRIDFTWKFFAVAGTATILIGVLSITYQALKAAYANPVNSLRHE